MLTRLQPEFARSRTWLAALAAVVSPWLFPAAAEAGTYKMYSCNVPGHNVPIPSAGPWRAMLDGFEHAAIQRVCRGR